MGSVADFPGPRAWRDHCQRTANGTLRTTLANACVLFRQAPEFRGRLAFNEFSLRTIVMAPLPWSDDIGRHWDNHDDTAATEFAQLQDLYVRRDVVQQAVERVAYENRFHPVRAWLAGLKWDGKPRLSQWLTYYLGAEPTPYTAAAGRAFLISAVARVMEPGCKADHVLILEGGQGIGKSTAVKILAGQDWFTDEIADIGSKDAAMQMLGRWMIELAELDQFRRADSSRAKSWISRTTDMFRPPYGARVIEAPRQCVFIGTSNRDDYFRDETGNRRYWPVRCNAIDAEALRSDRDQLFAEATAAYVDHEKWWITDPDALAEAKQEQSHRNEEDPWERRILRWLDTDTGTKVTTHDILASVLAMKDGDMNSSHGRRVARIMTRAGWKQKVDHPRSGQSQRIWYMPE